MVAHAHFSMGDIHGHHRVRCQLQRVALIALIGGLLAMGDLVQASDCPPEEVAKLLPSDGSSNDLFGIEVDVDGEYAIVGSWGNDEQALEAGAAYVYRQQADGSWLEIAKLLAADGQPHDRFGSSVAISGDIAVVGSPGAYQGRVYVFERDLGGPNNWGQRKKLQGIASNKNFGISVDIDGDTIIGGADEYDFPADRAGDAYIFQRHWGGTDNWGQVAHLESPSNRVGNFFGHSVGISADTVVVGAYGINEKQGCAFIYERDDGGADNWGYVKSMCSPGGTEGDWFGEAVGISGDRIIVGAVGYDGAYANSGAAFIYGRDHGGSGNWGRVTQLNSPDVDNEWQFSEAVAIHGDYAIVGDRVYSDEFSQQGSAYLFERSMGGLDSWGHTAKFTASDADSSDWFGTSLACDGEMIFIGADGANGTGAAYFIDLDPVCPCVVMQVRDLIAGEQARFDIVGGTEGETIAIAWGLQPGSTVIEGYGEYCASFGIKGVNVNRIVGFSTTTNGIATVFRQIPTNTSGLNLLFQAAERGTCPEKCMSNLIEVTIE